MDAKLFRYATYPNFYSAVQTAHPYRAEGGEGASRLSRDEPPTQDVRYPGWAAPMSDGRLATDYRPRCMMNIPVGQQYATREWMKKNTDEIVRISRSRMAERTGAGLPFDSTVVPPAAVYVRCSETDCERLPVDNPMAIGVERLDAEAPALFGTYMPLYRVAPAPNTPLTTKYEGGRNTPRGVVEMR